MEDREGENWEEINRNELRCNAISKRKQKVREETRNFTNRIKNFSDIDIEMNPKQSAYWLIG